MAKAVVDPLESVKVQVKHGVGRLAAALFRMQAMTEELGALTVLRATWSKKTDDAAVEKATETAVRELAAAGLGIRSVQPVQSSLEEVFAELTRAPDAPKGPDDEEDAA